MPLERWQAYLAYRLNNGLNAPFQPGKAIPDESFGALPKLA